MGDEQRNAASVAAKRLVELTSDPDRFDEMAAMIADNLVARDRRRLIGLPDIGKADFLEVIHASYGMELTTVVNEIVQVRGHRTELGRTTSRYADGSVKEYITISQWDPTVSQVEQLVRFDHDDLDTAIAELDRMHAAIEGDEG